MRRVKKTTNEQFDLLKAEMAVHPAAARGYGVGAQRAVVDAEWKDIVEKLNALGPPERTMTEWKKVWSDLRLRSIKRLSDEFTPKPRKVKYKSKKDKLLEGLCSTESIYASYGNVPEIKSYSSPINIDEESHKSEEEESYENPLAEDELVNTEKHFYNSSHDNSYDISSLAEKAIDKIYHNSNSDCTPARDVLQVQLSPQKERYFGQALSIIEKQMRNQNQMMEHLTLITENLVDLIENHVVNLEQQNKVNERQLRTTQNHNSILRRQEARILQRSKCKINNLQKF